MPLFPLDHAKGKKIVQGNLQLKRRPHPSRGTTIKLPEKNSTEEEHRRQQNSGEANCDHKNKLTQQTA